MKTNVILVLLLLFTVFDSYSQDTLREIKVQSKRKSMQKSYTLTGNTTLVTKKELLKAACCNLAESFETNPSIDVNFSDALTGTKQIKMLGLTSPYLMMTQENIPSVRGASQAYGLSFTPGPWIESIQITKGAGSVVNGFESISGQINTELIKPMSEVPFLLNLYGSTDSRFELNADFNQKISDKWATSLLLHGNMRNSKMDNNDDGFLDNPLQKQFNVLNRYQYYNPETGWVSFINLQYMNDTKQMGQISFNPDTDKGTTSSWGSEIDTQKIDVSTKIGYVFKDMPFQSFGFQNSFSSYDQDSYFGLRNYNIKQNSFYSNLIFNSIINNEKNKFATGLNFTYDSYSEFLNATDYSRIDNTVGAFFEYTFDNQDNFSLILGGRVDYGNRLGVFATPRVHMKYNPWEKGVLRISAGRGKRSANIFAENQNLFASSRTFNIVNAGGKLYGLDPEIAWNYGLSFMQGFKLFNRNGDITADFYRTNFQNQIVVDVMQSPQQVIFHNLDGASFANSFQLEFNYELAKRLELRSAYKYYDIKTDYLSGKFQRPLQAAHRFFGNLGYETGRTDKGQQWKFDFTYNWIGEQQLPYTASNPAEFRLDENSPAYSLMNAQITRVFSSNFEVYAGGENIGNYTQNPAIVDAENPFGPNFDATIVYAPVFGQMYYAGLRFKIK
ncbi:TonB-dependent receptor plug domain-containing protein [Flavobacterium aquicola]|uniref:Outer membrane receptor for ferrienterochelin and colicin n=1 Tax=Flavobacterium aquicola TaxID=1682742 RepID=A0A3E0ESS7_9FLAO|nr:TonB-dependent receptor [Flavobacterium aquicola]REH00440.1 outer membrane receptor for ferrienterochelin and colicin [Flavobacterium aquicola]